MPSFEYNYALSPFAKLDAVLKLAQNVEEIFIYDPDTVLESQPSISETIKGRKKLIALSLAGPFSPLVEVFIQSLHPSLKDFRLDQETDEYIEILPSLINMAPTLNTLYLHSCSIMQSFPALQVPPIWSSVRTLELVECDVFVSILDQTFPNLVNLTVAHDDAYSTFEGEQREENVLHTCAVWKHLEEVHGDADGLWMLSLKSCKVGALEIDDQLFDDEGLTPFYSTIKGLEPRMLSVQVSGDEVVKLLPRIADAAQDLMVLFLTVQYQTLDADTLDGGCFPKGVSPHLRRAL